MSTQGSPEGSGARRDTPLIATVGLSGPRAHFSTASDTHSTADRTLPVNNHEAVQTLSNQDEKKYYGIEKVTYQFINCQYIIQRSDLVHQQHRVKMLNTFSRMHAAVVIIQ